MSKQFSTVQDKISQLEHLLTLNLNDGMRQQITKQLQGLYDLKNKGYNNHKVLGQSTKNIEDSTSFVDILNDRGKSVTAQRKAMDKAMEATTQRIKDISAKLDNTDRVGLSALNAVSALPFIGPLAKAIADPINRFVVNQPTSIEEYEALQNELLGLKQQATTMTQNYNDWVNANYYGDASSSPGLSKGSNVRNTKSGSQYIGKSAETTKYRKE